MKKAWKLALSVVGVLALAAPAHADSIVLSNTGVTAPNDQNGDNSNIQTSGGAQDIYYTVVSTPSGVQPANTPALVVTDQGAYYRPGNSQYINDTGSGGNNELPGYYDYQTTFNIPALDNPLTATISGTVYVDNAISDILVNGASTGITGGSFGSGSELNFTIPAGNANFKVGSNTLDFVVYNAPAVSDTNPTGANPTALDVTLLHGTVTPEPGSVSLMGLGALGLLARRRKA